MSAIARDLVPAGILAAMTGLWWYLRSYVLYDNLTGMVGDFRTAQFAGRRHNIAAWLAQWRFTVDSFWGVWGWLEVRLPDVYYRTLSWLSVVSLVPALGAGLERRSLHGTARAVAVFWMSVTLAYTLVMAVVAAQIGPLHNNQGRHWLALVPVPALVLAVAGATISRYSRFAACMLLAVWCTLLTAANARLVVDTSRFYGGYVVWSGRW